MPTQDIEHRTKRIAPALILAFVFSSSFAHADDWPQFRGPNRDGIYRETGLVKSFPPTGLKIEWRTPIGPGWGSPVVVAGRVIITDAVLKKPVAKIRVQSLDEATGKQQWQYECLIDFPDWAFNFENGGSPSSTPIVEKDRVYSIMPDAHVNCLNATNGNLIWENDLAKKHPIKELSVRPSPLIEGNLVIFCIGGKPGASVVALDKETGKEVWKALDDGVSNSSPIIVEAGGTRQLVVWTDDSVTSLNPTTGAVYWTFPMVTSNNDSIPTPVVLKNRMLISGVMFELDPDHPAAKILWPDPKVGGSKILSNTSSPVLEGDYVYSARSGGPLVCLEAATGKEVWNCKTVTGLKQGAAINITPEGDESFLFTDLGDLILAHLTPKGYEEISRMHLLEATTPFIKVKCAWVPPAYAHHHLFARNDVEIVCASLAP